MLLVRTVAGAFGELAIRPRARTITRRARATILRQGVFSCHPSACETTRLALSVALALLALALRRSCACLRLARLMEAMVSKSLLSPHHVSL